MSISGDPDADKADVDDDDDKKDDTDANDVAHPDVAPSLDTAVENTSLLDAAPWNTLLLAAEVTLIEVENTDHFDVVENLAKPDYALTKELLRWLADMR